MSPPAKPQWPHVHGVPAQKNLRRRYAAHVVRRMYNSWVISLVISQLKFKAAEQVTVPSDVPTCKTNLFKWLSAAVDELNKDGTGILHCWTKTKLLRAWEGPVQAEAARRAEELFPNMSNGDFLPADFKEDEEAGFMGLPFTLGPAGRRRRVDGQCALGRGPGRGLTLVRLCGPRPGAGVYR